MANRLLQVFVLLLGSVTTTSFASRLTAYFDDGSSVTVDNISSMPELTVRTLVLVADRSTQSGCPFNTARKGLIKSGDRIVVGNHYVAWIDMTPTDGVQYQASMGNGAGYTRSGEITGFWTLNPVTQMFKHFTPASSFNCWNWPRNELIPGSASPNGEKFWWDRYTPPSEHTIAVVTSLDSLGNGANDGYTFLSSVYTQSASNGMWSLSIDGRDNGDGSVTFLSGGRMTNDRGQVDVEDANDSNGIQATIDYELEQVFRARDVLVAWRFRPSKTIDAKNVYVYYWIAHAPGQGSSSVECPLPHAPNSYRPNLTFTQSWFVHAYVPLVPTFETGGNPSYFQFPAGQPVPMMPGQKCVLPNRDVNTWQSEVPTNSVVANGTWIRAGESPTVYSPDKRYLTFVNLLGYPNGTGEKSNPYNFRFNRLVASNETSDGHYGFGLVNGPFNDRSRYLRLTAGKWYYSLHALSSDY